MTETIDGDAELIIRDQAAPTLFNTDEPRLFMARASGVADVLNEVIEQRKLFKMISGKRYVLVEGWTTLGALVNVFGATEWTRELTDGEGVSLGWEAAVVVVNGQGVQIGRAEAECLRSEKNWKSRDDFALKSMAQTRAMGKALRMVLGWIAVLAGYEATPAEEMPAVVSNDVPFDETGGQGQEANPSSGIDDGEAHGNDPGTAARSTEPAMTREEAVEHRRADLTEKLHDLCHTLGKDENETTKKIANDRLKKTPAGHLTWLETQVENAYKAVAKQQEIPL